MRTVAVMRESLAQACARTRWGAAGFAATPPRPPDGGAGFYAPHRWLLTGSTTWQAQGTPLARQFVGHRYRYPRRRCQTAREGVRTLVVSFL